MKQSFLALPLILVASGASVLTVSAQCDFIAQASDKSWSTSDWQPSHGSLLPVGSTKSGGASNTGSASTSGSAVNSTAQVGGASVAPAANQQIAKPLLPVGNVPLSSPTSSSLSAPAQNSVNSPSAAGQVSTTPGGGTYSSQQANEATTETTAPPPVAPSIGNGNPNSPPRSRLLPALQQAASRAAQRYGNGQGVRPFNQAGNAGGGGYNPQFNSNNSPNPSARMQSQNPAQRDFSRAAVPPGALVDTNNSQLNYAQQFEQKGEWFQAAQFYSNALRSAGGDLTQADIQAANRNHTSGVAEMFKRMASDPRQGEIGKHMAHCNCMLLNERYAEKTGNTDLKFSEDAMGKSYYSMEDSEPNNGMWSYLAGVYGTDFTHTSEYNYVQAMVHLNKAMGCGQISPSVKQKVVALRHYLFPAFLLQLKDMDRAKFDHMMGIVYNVEHPTITLYKDRAGTVVSKFDSRQTLDTAFYGLCKDMLKNDYPGFINNYNALVQHCRSLPNKGMPVPGGAGSAELSEYCPNHWEEKAFGPLDFRVGRL